MKDTSKINKWINIDFNYFNLSMYIRNKIMNITFLYMVLVNSILLLLINKVNAIFFLLLQIINIILVIVIIKIIEKVNKKMDLFADYLEYEMIGKLSHRLLESKLKKLDVKKFHICRELNEKGYIKYWAIYNNENLFDPENKPILDSNKNDLVDLELFIDKIKKEK